MGYSPRYHVASLTAVFLALAVGILIGAEFGDDIVSSTRRNLEQSLSSNLADERERAGELASELGRSNEFAELVYPVLVRERLAGVRVGILALGGFRGDLSSQIEDALQPTGATLVSVGVVREPPDLGGLAADLSETRFADLETDADTVQALGTGVGRQLVIGGALLDRVRSELFSRVSGRFGDVDALIVARDQPDNLDSSERSASARLEAGLIDGVTATRITGVGVEASDSDPSSIPFFQSGDIASVDDIDQVAGRVAMVFALLGARGSFGTKDSADSLLPDLLEPVPAVQTPAPRQSGLPNRAQPRGDRAARDRRAGAAG